MALGLGPRQCIADFEPASRAERESTVASTSVATVPKARRTIPVGQLPSRLQLPRSLLVYPSQRDLLLFQDFTRYQRHLLLECRCQGHPVRLGLQGLHQLLFLYLRVRQEQGCHQGHVAGHLLKDVLEVQRKQQQRDRLEEIKEAFNNRRGTRGWGASSCIIFECGCSFRISSWYHRQDSIVGCKGW